MSIRIIALDMDGTTLMNDHQSISPRTEQAIRNAIAKGILIVPATGRLNSLLPESVMKLGGIRYAITSNGAVTYNLSDGKIMNSCFLSPPLAEKVMNQLPTDKLLVEFFKDGKIYVERKYMESLTEYPLPFLHLDFLKSIHRTVESLSGYVKNKGERIEKINLPFIPPEYREEIWSRLTVLDGISLTSSVPNNIEVNELQANKGAALKQLCESLQIPREEVMAFGDNGNDLEMLEYAGLSFAPANGTDEAKAAATAVTAANDEDGVAIAIEQYALA